MTGSPLAVGVGCAVLALAALHPVPAVRRRRGARPDPQARTRGRTSVGSASARWARTGDLRELIVANRGPAPPGRLVLGRSGRRLLAAEASQSVIVFGPTQSHKTSGFAVPAILDWQGPVVAASVKSDLLEHTAAHRRTLGRVQCFDPTGVTGIPPSPWSPLPAARTWPGARRAAATLTEVGRSSVGTMQRRRLLVRHGGADARTPALRRRPGPQGDGRRPPLGGDRRGGRGARPPRRGRGARSPRCRPLGLR